MIKTFDTRHTQLHRATHCVYDIKKSVEKHPNIFLKIFKKMSENTLTVDCRTQIFIFLTDTKRWEVTAT